MYLTWTALFMLVGLAAAVAFWHSSLAARERANSAALDACERLRLQFLDGTVAFANLALTRRPGGKLSLRRTYVFDYTADSIERRQGFVILTGPRLDSVGFANETATLANGMESAPLPQGPSRFGTSPRLASGSPAPDSSSATSIHPKPSTAERSIRPETSADSGRAPPEDNVLDFAEWRRRSRQRAHADRHGGHGERKG